MTHHEKRFRQRESDVEDLEQREPAPVSKRNPIIEVGMKWGSRDLRYEIIGSGLVADQRCSIGKE